MEVIYARCCGLDIHKQTVVACVIVPGPERQPRKEVRTFGTMTADLLALSDWLAAQGVTHVYLGSRGGPIGEAVLDESAAFRRVYQRDAVSIYELLPSATIADSSPKVPEDSPGPRLNVGVPRFRRTSR